MTRWRGRALAGGRLLARIPHGHYQTSTLISGMRLQGPCAPWLFEGPMNGEMFLAWVRQGLAPTLQKGDLVIMDNLATHKIAGIREAIEAAGARLLYLPPYSPDCNPIENMWSKIKQILRGQDPRTESALLLAAKMAFQAISSADCQGYFLALNTLYNLWNCSSAAGHRRFYREWRGRARRWRREGFQGGDGKSHRRGGRRQRLLSRVPGCLTAKTEASRWR